jgi:PIN domain nuclease of toxin-antitoxin system
MRLLLDTHIFLWYITGDERLPGHFRRAIEESDAAYVSVVSLWEATIKHHLGKLQLPDSPHPWLSDQREQHGIESLPLTEAAVARLGALHLHHRDPFDRMLVCQSLEHDLLIVTVDAAFANYPANLLANNSPH